jgi:hypothetical protein
MRIPIIVTALSIVFSALTPPAHGVESYGDYPAGKLSVEVWFDEAKGSVYEPGESVEVFFTATHDCYVVVYDVDTQGFVNVLYPRGEESSWVEGGRIFSIPGPYDQYDLTVEGPKGIEYIVAVASPYPLDVRSLHPETDEWGDGYNYTGRIAGDPHEAIYELNERLAWGSSAYEAEGYSSDIGWFYVEREVPWPRYLVYHNYPDRFWDPYWDPYVEVDFFVDYSWDHRWCRTWWWCHGCRPIHNYWYVDHSSGLRVKWKHWNHHGNSGHPEWRRVKPPRWDSRLRSSRTKAVKPSPNRTKESRSLWDDGGRRTRDIIKGDHHIRQKDARKRSTPERIEKKPRVKSEPKRVDKKSPRLAEPKKVKKESKPKKIDKKPTKKSEPRKADKPKKKSEPKKKDSKDNKDKRPRKR